MQHVPIGFNNINVENTKTIDSRTYVYDLFFLLDFKKDHRQTFYSCTQSLKGDLRLLIS